MPPARFITDASLELVARRLRALGHDVEVVRGARLDELFDAARRRGRIVLSLSARRPRPFADVPALRLPRADAAAAVRVVDAAYPAAGGPFSRCSACNGALQRRSAFEARGEVPPRVLRGVTHLHHCPECGRWYWEGSHTRRLREWLVAALGHPLPPPPGDGAISDTTS
jgi:uncharacterized protein with PIN domain